MRHDRAHESAQRAARWIKRSQAGDHVEQQFLAKVRRVVGGQPKRSTQPAGGGIGFMLDQVEVGGGD